VKRKSENPVDRAEKLVYNEYTMKKREVIQMSIAQRTFGILPTGEKISAYILKNKNLEVTISTYGARIAKALFHGVSVIAGFDSLDGHLADGDYHGSTVGRYANRISDGKFVLNGKQYTLACNEEARGEHLHGGKIGFSSRIWEVKEVLDRESASSITLSLFSPDGEEGYPGNLQVTVTFTVADDAISIDYQAKTDADTIINLTNHSYFNLSGVGNTILDHHLKMACDHFVPVNERLIPFGELADVTGTPFDFRQEKTIGDDIEAENEQIAIAGGYDHCFVRGKGENTQQPEWIATLSSPLTHISMDILTTEGGIQMYTGNFMTAPNPFFGTIPQRKNEAVALECNKIPDSPNQLNFPSPVLKKGETYLQTTVYRFYQN
jgi:aldose 1-epimerase